MPLGTKNTTLPGCGLHHISIQTQDFAASLRLYRDVLGMSVRLERNTGGRDFALLDMGDGSYIELQTIKPEGIATLTGSSCIAHYALASSDVRGAIERVRAAGYPVTVEPKDIQINTLSATIAFFTGPSGESVELFQEK